MKIIKNKYLQKAIILLALSGTVFLTLLGYGLGWLSEGFNFEHFLIFIAIIVGEVFLFWLIYFVLQRFNKSYYIIQNNTITLFKKGIEFSSFELKNMRNIYYNRFFWAILMQFGAGFLMFEYIGETKIKPEIKYSNGLKLYGIAMSKKHAVEMAKILSIAIPIN